MDELKKSIEEIGFSKTARATGLSFEALKARYANDTGEYGRPGMRKYVVAVKLHERSWPAKYTDAIIAARVKYDRGTHELAQGRSGKHTVLYLIPRLVPTKPRTYFSTATPN
jgi:hypothetical protein